MLNKLREMYKNREVALGTFFNVGDMSCMECLGFAGMDFVIIDTEHGSYDTMDMMNLIRAAEHAELAPIVRLADVSHKEIQRAADCGALAIIIPCLREVEEYKKLVDLAKYTPIGNRGYIRGRGSGFGYQDWANGHIVEFMANANEKLMVMPQCETVESLEHIEEIMAIEGVDAIFIGPYDLSATMGIPGEFESPKFIAAVERIIAAAKANDKPAYIYTSTPAEAKMRMAQGADGIANSMSAVMIVEAYKKMVKDIKV